MPEPLPNPHVDLNNARNLSKQKSQRFTDSVSLPKLHSNEYNKAWAMLVREVNARRYRGPRRDEPMEDRYYWPLEIAYMDGISKAALALVVAAEREAH